MFISEDITKKNGSVPIIVTKTVSLFDDIILYNTLANKY